MRRALMALLFCLVTALAGQAQAVTLKIATLAPDGTRWMQEMRKGAEEIARLTQGRVKFKLYPGGVMGNNSSVLRKIRVGQLHGGMLPAGGLEAVYPDIQIYSLPFIFRSYAEVDYVRKQMDKLIIKGLKQRGFISLVLGEGGFAYLMSNKPIRRVDDLQGQKVWVPTGDRISRVGFEAVNVSPISLPLTDVLTGLQTGLIDTIGNSPVGAIALQWHTRIKYLTDTPLLYLYGSLVIQRRAFEKLKPKDQAIVRRVMATVSDKLDRQTRLDNNNARQALKRQGVTFVELSQAGWKEWHRKVSEAMKRLIQKGPYTAAMLTKLRGHLEDYRRRHGAP